MAEKPSKAELVGRILEQEAENGRETEDVIHLLLDNTVSQNTELKRMETLSFGDRLADKIATLAGSWRFIISFVVILVFWMVLNAVILPRPFDSYPFILLNLALSCVAALQAPVIMMSQNRQESKDRLRAENDYKVNLKSEVIIEDIHAKLDRLIENQEAMMARIRRLEENGKE